MSGDDVERVKRALPSVRRYIEGGHGQHSADFSPDGSELRGPHPVHGSTTGTNFSVNDDVWYCHREGHKTGGGILEWIAVDEGIVGCGEADDLSNCFGEVLRVAADRAGVDLNGEFDAEEAREYRETREKLDAVYETAVGYYQDQLTPKWRDWLNQQYGLSLKFIDEAGIGFAPPADTALLTYLKAKGFDENDALESGLVVSTGDGLKDFFSGRVVFPYYQNGTPRYFIGRETAETPDKPWENGKYRKLPRPSEKHQSVSELVDEPVFGLDTVTGEGHVVVTEGITDALALHQAGYPALAPVTTSFKKNRVAAVSDALRGKDVTVIFDEDAESEAGLSGAVKTASMLQERIGGEVRVGRLPAGDDEDIDVCEFLRQQSTAALDDVIETAVPAHFARYAWGDGDAADLYAAALAEIDWPPGRVAIDENDDGDDVELGVWDIIEASDLTRAHRQFERRQTLLDGSERLNLYQELITLELTECGQFFRTRGDTLYYFYDPDGKVYQVDGDGNRTVAREFKGLIDRRFSISPSQWSRNLLEGVTVRAFDRAPSRDIHTFATFDRDAGELYINDFDTGYYVLDGDEIAHRKNGTDVFFADIDAEPYHYLPESDRYDVPESIPGERPMWLGDGDAIHRFITNRINYSEDAALAPAQQRKQLYLHLHALPFYSLIDSRPIMAWVGEKGSGKTVSQRAIGRFIYGPDFTEGVLPDNKEDFLAIVTNRRLAFIDNFDDGVDWANDVLAAVATGAAVQLRELYTTSDLAQFSPDCWLSITSRDPPFRRDDVADRTLVFRVERLDENAEEFIGVGDYLRQVELYRDVIWSAYLDNLNEIVAEYRQTETENMSSSHRMADWAIMARVVSNSLDVADVDDLLQTMETERATFALENDPLAQLIGEWIDNQPTDAAKWRTAGELLDRLQELPEEWPGMVEHTSAAGLGSRLVQVRNELGTIYNFEIDDSRRSNRYRFDVDDSTSAGRLSKF